MSEGGRHAPQSIQTLDADACRRFIGATVLARGRASAGRDVWQSGGLILRANAASKRQPNGDSALLDRVVIGVRYLLTITRTAAAVFLIASVGINFVNIIGRYFFSVSIPWAEEVMLFLMVGCVFTGCCAVAWDGRQIRMDVVLRTLPHKLRELIEVLSELTMIAAAGTVTVFAWPVITQLAAFDERSEAANSPLAVPQAMVPVGYALMALVVAVRLLVRSRGGSANRGDTSH